VLLPSIYGGGASDRGHNCHHNVVFSVDMVVVPVIVVVVIISGHGRLSEFGDGATAQ
jgi:hypothetical protein